MSQSAFLKWLADIVSTLCPGGKKRMRRLINVVQSGRFDPNMLVTHRFSLADIKQGYEVFGNRAEGVLITP
jgi:threonine dehydrogenase-like Zn-dependent dehydrogenase